MRHRRSFSLLSLVGASMAIFVGAAVLGLFRPVYGETPALFQETRLTASDPVELALLGVALAIDGDTLVAGAPNFLGPGAAYVFVRTEAGWSQQQKLTPEVEQTGFGRYVAINGGTLAVSSPSGVYVFVRSGATWSLERRLIASGPGGIFAGPVAISGDTMVVGFPGAPGSFGRYGAAYVFVRDASGWNEVQRLTPNDGGADFFGDSVAIDGDTIAVGDPALASSSVYVFSRTGSYWSQMQKLQASDAGIANNFGCSVALAGERMLIGAFSDPSMGYRAGAAYVFADHEGTWLQEAKLLPADPVPPGDLFGKYFGATVALNGDWVLIGASADSVGLGAAYLFESSGASWNQVQKLTVVAPLTGGFGLSVALAGDTAAIGSGFGSDAEGAVFIFVPPSQLPPIANAGPDQTVECTSPSGARVQLDGTRSLDPAGGSLSYLWTGPFGEASGATPTVPFPLGQSIATLTVANARSATGTDAVQIRVRDTTAPSISAVTAQPNVLWPPNHRLVDVTVAIAASDTCDAAPTCAIEFMTSTESTEGGATITGPLQVELQAERLETGPGRTYTIVVGCLDSAGNHRQATVDVVVPHDLSKP